jgi:hypothetical protein
MSGIPAFVRNGRLDILGINALGRALYSQAFDNPGIGPARAAGQHHPVRLPRPAGSPASHFTGDVYLNPIYRGEEPSRMIVSLVRFTPGARNNWHSHAVGQTLRVTDGVGLVAIWNGTVIRMRAGTPSIPRRVRSTGRVAPPTT